MAAPDTRPTLICDYLEQLAVPHTAGYSNDRFSHMPFPTMFGLVKLLEEYGIDSRGYLLTDKSEITRIKPPFLARTPGGYTIVTGIGHDRVSYLTQGVAESMPLADFTAAWDGNVVVSVPRPDAREPGYAAHARIEFFSRAKRWVLAACVIALLVYASVEAGIWRHLSTVLLMAIDLGGIYLTYLLVQKSLNIHNAAADHVCSIIQAGGCDSILSMKASKFFGLFGWSEVGFAYFSVSLLAMLLCPWSLPMLALCNVCCLPFTAWSIWYQRFRAHHWCTLCVCVQASLWLLFFCYLGGGWLKLAWPPTIGFIVLGLTYLSVMLAINALMPLISNKNSDNDSDNTPPGSEPGQTH